MRGACKGGGTGNPFLRGGIVRGELARVPELGTFSSWRNCSRGACKGSLPGEFTRGAYQGMSLYFFGGRVLMHPVE